MNLKSLEVLPPGGWIYEQPVTGMKFRDMGPFGACAKQILMHRIANNLSRATIAEAGEDLEAATCQRLGGDEQWCIQKKTQPPVGFQSPGPGAALAALSKYKTGTQILRDWWGDNMVPVERTVAENRASVCINCDQNQAPHFLDKIVDKVAEAIKEQMSAKRDMGMEVTTEAKLKMCHVCRCHLPLKVWVPMETIMGRTSPTELEKFEKANRQCWMVTENKLSDLRPMKI